MRTPPHAVALLVVLSACGADDADLGGPVRVDLAGPPAPLLSTMRLLRWEAGSLTYNDRVVPYEMNTPLFSDYSLKYRAIHVPEGATATYVGGDVFDFPVGTVLVKTFAYPPDLRAPDRDVALVETRLLIRYPTGWQAWPYLWEDDQSDARLAPSGQVRTISFVDAEGRERTSSYLVPQRNQCQECHERSDGAGETFITPIGPRARNLHREHDYGPGVGVTGQLARLEALGMLRGLPPASEIEAATDFAPIAASGHAGLSDEALDAAARDYLDVNCAHCHNPRGVQGITSQLFLDRDNDDRFRLGVCKRPGSAGAGTGGLEHDIVPGDPDASILVFRVETTEVGAMMPLLGRSLTDDRGAALLREWVARMPPETCDAP